MGKEAVGTDKHWLQTVKPILINSLKLVPISVISWLDRNTYEKLPKSEKKGSRHGKTHGKLKNKSCLEDRRKECMPRSARSDAKVGQVYVWGKVTVWTYFWCFRNQSFPFSSLQFPSVKVIIEIYLQDSRKPPSVCNPYMSVTYTDTLQALSPAKRTLFSGRRCTTAQTCSAWSGVDGSGEQSDRENKTPDLVIWNKLP